MFQRLVLDITNVKGEDFEVDSNILMLFVFVLVNRFDAYIWVEHLESHQTDREEIFSKFVNSHPRVYLVQKNRWRRIAFYLLALIRKAFRLVSVRHNGVFQQNLIVDHY